MIKLLLTLWDQGLIDNIQIMKLDWGKSIVLAMVLFISFIMYMVITMTTQKEYNHDMVVEEYYKKEMTLNDKLEKINNGKEFEDDITFKANQKGLLLAFPESLKDLKTAKIYAYRASDKNLDFNTSISLNKIREALIQKNLASGPWEFTLEFTVDKKQYLIKKNMNIQ